MTRSRDIYDRCYDTRACCFAVIRGAHRYCRALRGTDKEDGKCRFCKKNINDRTDKEEEA